MALLWRINLNLTDFKLFGYNINILYNEVTLINLLYPINNNKKWKKNLWEHLYTHYYLF